MVKDLSILLKGWDFAFIDALGRSRGLITGWKKDSLSLSNSWAFPFGLGTSLYSLEFAKEFTYINIYDPYSEVRVLRSSPSKKLDSKRFSGFRW